jgi:hypothetical protein
MANMNATQADIDALSDGWYRRMWLWTAGYHATRLELRRAFEAFWNSLKQTPPREWRTGTPLVGVLKEDAWTSS